MPPAHSNCPLPLSQLAHKNNVLSGVLELTNCRLTHLDPVSPFICAKTHSLMLGHNRLTSLTNLKQFGFLKELDVSHNRIREWKELSVLKDMPQVTAIKIAGNPLLDEPIQPDILQMLQGRQTDI